MSAWENDVDRVDRAWHQQHIADVLELGEEDSHRKKISACSAGIGKQLCSVRVHVEPPRAAIPEVFEQPCVALRIHRGLTPPPV